MDFKVVPIRVTRALIIITVCLAFASLAGQFYIYFLNGNNFLQIVSLFNLDDERNIPTVFSALILLLCSILLEFITLGKQRNKDNYASHWQGLAMIFMYLSFDEFIEFHERINRVLNQIVQSTENQYWDILNVVFVIIFALVYAKFFFHLPKKIQHLFMLAFFLFVMGGVGIELIGVNYWTHIYHQQSFLSQVITTIEECLEIIGVAIFIHALLLYISSFMKNIHVNFVTLGKKGFQQ